MLCNSLHSKLKDWWHGLAFQRWQNIEASKRRESLRLERWQRFNRRKGLLSRVSPLLNLPLQHLVWDQIADAQWLVRHRTCLIASVEVGHNGLTLVGLPCLAHHRFIHHLVRDGTDEFCGNWFVGRGRAHCYCVIAGCKKSVRICQFG